MLNALTRWTPTSSSLVSRDPLRMFDPFFNDFLGEEVSNRTWMPPVNIQETEDSFRLEADLPGLTRDDIHITLENNVLRLSGERKLEKDVKKENYHRIERSYGTFTRSFALPSQVDAEKVHAAFDNGVLTVTVPKTEQAKPRKIQVN